MKKILTILLFFIGLSAQAQEIQSRIDSLYYDFTDEYFNGSLSRAEAKRIKMIRANALWSNLVASVGIGDNTTAGYCLDELNDILGTSYGLPSFSFGEATSSYLNPDSIKTTSMSEYLDSLLSAADVISLINANPSVDSNFVYQSIQNYNDSTSSTKDSSFVSADFDTAYFGQTDSSAVAIYSANSDNSFNIKAGGVEVAYFYESGGTYNTGSNVFGYVFGNSNTGSFASLALAANNSGTRLYQTSAGDKIQFQINTDSLFTIGYYNSFTDPLCVFNSELRVLDSLRLPYALDAESEVQWLGLSPFGAVFADSLDAAGFALTMKTIGPVRRLYDRKNGEIAWYVDGSKEYDLKGRPTETIQKLQASDEISIRHIANNRILIYVLLIIIGLLIINQVRLERCVK